jgi:hypothetical protein
VPKLKRVYCIVQILEDTKSSPLYLRSNFRFTGMSVTCDLVQELVPLCDDNLAAIAWEYNRGRRCTATNIQK